MNIEEAIKILEATDIKRVDFKIGTKNVCAYKLPNTIRIDITLK